MKAIVKKILAWLLLFTIGFLSTYCLFSCRTMKKDITRADSSSKRTSETGESYWRETIRDIVAFPVNSYRPGVPKFIPGKDSVNNNTTTNNYIYKTREIVREGGEKQTANTEAKQADVVVKDIEKAPPDWMPWVIVGCFALLMLVILWVLSRILNRLPKIPN